MPLSGQKVTPAVLSVGLVAPPISTAAVGTPTASAGTETFDVVLNYYQAILIAGHTYEVKMNGLIGNSGANGDIYTLQIRDSQSGSNPVAASLLVAQAQWASTTNGTSSRQPIALAHTFVATVNGEHTFGFSSARTSGTGVFTPVSPPGLTRELFVVDLGGN